MSSSFRTLPVVRTVALALSAALSLTPVAAAQLVPQQSWDGVHSSDNWGRTVAVVGDVDGDGVRDLALGSPLSDVEVAGVQLFDTGRVQVVSGADGSLLHDWHGLAGNDAEFGFALCDAGDVDSDGFDDVLIGAPVADGGTADVGRVEVRSGATGLLLRLDVGLQTGARFGHALALGPDLDGDGVRDYAIGSPHERLFGLNGDADAPGTVRVLSGATGLPLAVLDGTALIPVAPASPTWFFEPRQWGTSLAFVKRDLVVGAPASDLLDVPPLFPSLATVLAAEVGLVARFDSSTWHRQWVRAGAEAGERWGAALSAPGGSQDLDGDVIADVFVGAPGVIAAGGELPVGAVAALSGVDGAPLDLLLGSLDVPFGAVLAGVGDVDGDGLPDLAAASPSATVSGAPYSGLVSLRSGAPGLPLLQTFRGGPSDEFGWAVAGGDVDGDGLAEVLVGAPSFDLPLQGDPGADAGQVQRFGAACQASWTHVGTPLSGTFGDPRLVPLADPVLGTTVALEVSNTAGALATCGLILGLSEVALPFKGGTLHTEPLLIVTLTLPAGGSLLDLAIPDDALLCDVVLMAQFAVQDPGAPVGVALSKGVRFVLGH